MVTVEGACGIIRNKYRLPGPLRGAVLRVKGWGLDVIHGVSATKILKFVSEVFQGNEALNFKAWEHLSIRM